MAEPAWIGITCPSCNRGRRIWPGTCVIVTPPKHLDTGDFLAWTCHNPGCGGQKLYLRCTNIGLRLRLYNMVKARLELQDRPAVPGRLQLDDVLDLDADLERLLQG